MFREKGIKEGTTAILKTDEFDIYNVQQIRKNLNKTKGLEDIRHISNEIYDNDNKNHVNDLRKKQIDYERTVDYINFPKTNINLYEKKVSDRFNGKIPQEIQLFMKEIQK